MIHYYCPEHIFDCVKKFAQNEMNFPLCKIDIYDYVEKLLVCSALIIDYNPHRDMKSESMKRYLDCFESDLKNKHSFKEWYGILEGALWCTHFPMFCESKTKYGRKYLMDYVANRLTVYKWLLYHKDRQKSLDVLSFLLFEHELDCGSFQSISHCEQIFDYAFIKDKEKNLGMTYFTSDPNYPVFIEWSNKFLSSHKCLYRFSPFKSYCKLKYALKRFLSNNRHSSNNSLKLL